MNSTKEEVLKEFISKIIIPKLKPLAVVLYGSYFTKLSKGSDIDLAIFLKDAQLVNPLKEIHKLREIFHMQNLNQETDISFIQDKENPRIEIKIIYKNTLFDLMITNSRVCCGNHAQDVSSDNFELYIGNLFVHSKMLFQKGNYYSNLKKRYLPYYNEDLRKRRMRLLKEDIRRLIGKLKSNSADFKTINAIYYLNRTLQSILQLKFMYHKVYPISYRKWMDYQFDNILNSDALLGKLNRFIKKTNLNKKDLSKLADFLSVIVSEL